MDVEDHAVVVRVAVLAPYAHLLSQALRAVGHADLTVTAVDGADPPPLLVDVVLVAGGWAPDHPLDLSRAVDLRCDRCAAPVVVLPGGEDPDMVADVLANARVTGVVATDILPGNLVDALGRTARRASHPAVHRLDAGPSLGDALVASDLLASVACSVVNDGAATWAQIAHRSGFSVRTVEGSPTRFAPFVRADLGLPADAPVTQPVLYHWLGTRAAYIRSWCRRSHGCRT